MNPDLGVLPRAALVALQEELFERLAEAGYAKLRPRHSAVLAYLDEDGVRASELARLSGRDKQVVGRLVDELEGIGYVERRPDPSDRRAKLIVPTERGLEQLRLRDEIVAEIETAPRRGTPGPALRRVSQRPPRDRGARTSRRFPRRLTDRPGTA